MGASFMFNWHEEEENSFYKWMVPTLIAEMPKEHFEALSATTDSFKQVQLSIKINGMDVDAKHMIESLQHNFDRNVAERAGEIIREINMDKLTMAVESAESAALKVLRKCLGDIGIELPEEF